MTIWTTWIPEDEREPSGAGPLAGVRLAVKDNIDVARLPTTAGCPEFAYTPERDARSVARLRAAGAVVVGKNVLDQFATGLTGQRAPSGPVACAADPAYISGGSSSGSAVAVATGEADLALGTDTAGSGRVPAAMNGIVGLKPTIGLISTDGMVPACRSLDCVSIFARDCRTARTALGLAVEPPGPGLREAARPVRGDLARAASPRIGLPGADRLVVDGGSEEARLLDAAAARLRALGARMVDVDLEPFLAAGRLLYDGPWVAERLAAVGDFIRRNPGATLDPAVRRIIMGAEGIGADDAFRGMYALDELRPAVARTFEDVDALLLPTVPFAPTIAEVAADPIGVNTTLGTYTTFVNLLDLCALALPAGTRANGVPYGIQLIAPAFSDLMLLDIGARFESATPAGADPTDGHCPDHSAAGMLTPL